MIMDQVKWLIGGPPAPEQVSQPQQDVQAEVDEKTIEAEVTPETTGKYKGKTADQWLDEGARAWKDGTPEGMVKSKEYRLYAQLAPTSGIMEFPALFTLTGALVPQSAWVRTRKGSWVWRVGNGALVQWFDPSRALSGAVRRRNDAAKGYAIGLIRARAYVAMTTRGGGVGLYIARSESSPIEIVDDGKLGTAYRDRSH